VIIHVSDHTEKNEIKKEIRRVVKIKGNYEKFIIVKSVKGASIRKSTYFPLKVIEI
jgi:hypothetical protein